MSSEEWKRTEEIWRALAAHQGFGSAGEHFRVMKLSEEVGEVVQALIGMRGANKRKGTTHNASHVASELCDVIITAMVALNDFTNDPEMFFRMHVARISRRVEEQGS